MNPNLTTYSLADQIERHHIDSRPELLATRRIRPAQIAEQPSENARTARLRGIALSLIGRVQHALPVRRQPALPR